MNYHESVIGCDTCENTLPVWQIGGQFIGGWCTNCAKWVQFPRPDEALKLADVRSVLHEFVYAMNGALDREGHHRHWLNCPDSELSSVLLRQLASLVTYLDKDEPPVRILRVAAEAASTLMMLSDPERLRNR